MNGPYDLISLHLPWPPSVNHIWKRTGTGKKTRTYLTDEGREYKTSVAQRVVIARANGAAPRNPLTGRVRYTLTLYPPDKRRRDISNAIKVVEDALTSAGVWVDDEQVDDLRVKRGRIVKGGLAVIEIESEG